MDALHGVRAWLPPDARVNVPAVYYFDSALHAVIMDDAGPHAATLKGALLAGQIPTPRAAALGTELGQFLRGLHTWGRGTEEGGKLRDALGANVFARDIYALVTYGRLGATLRTPGSTAGVQEPLPALGDEPLGVSEETLRVVEALAERRSAQIRDVRGETLVMGDFWPGNVLVGVEDNDSPTLVVDWEIARPGLAGVDVGQLHPDRAKAAGEVLRNICACVLCGRRWARGGREAESGIGPLWRAPCRLDAEGRMECGSASEAWSASVFLQISFRGFVGFKRFLSVFTVSGNQKPGNLETYLPITGLYLCSSKQRANYSKLYGIQTNVDQ